MRRIACAACLVLLPAFAFAGEREPWPSLLGSGYITLPDTQTLGRGRWFVAATVDNRDRDPLGLDVLDGALAVTSGLGERTEAYGRAVLSRVVAMPEPPPLPPPFLDIVVAPGATAPARPRYAIYAPSPYVNKRGRARFDSWIPGDGLIGVKRRLLEASPGRPALALAAELTFPLSRDLFDLQSGSGTGALDVALRAAADWELGRWRLGASAGYVRTGRPPYGDRTISVASDGSASVADEPLDLPDRLEAGLALRRPLSSRLAAVLETSVALPVARRTAVVDSAWPLDVLAGLQGRAGAARFTAALRYHGHDLPSGERRPAPVAGLIELTDTPEPELQAYLRSVGAGTALASLRPRSQRLLAAKATPPLPTGARVIAPDYAIRSEHQVGFVLLVGWSF